MHLSPEDMAAAEACGVTFLPATPAQVQRLAMQRKIFHAGGQPVLATRGDGFYETAGTLRRLIEEGLRRRDPIPRPGGGASAPGPAPAGPVEGPEETAEGEAAAPALPAAAGPVAAGAEEDGPPARPAGRETAPQRVRRHRRREAPVPGLAVVPTPQEPPAAELPPRAEAATEAGRSVAGAARPRQAAPRWMMAGAARRGRAAKHWSTRQR